MKYSVLIACLLAASVASAAQEGYGISSWANWKPGQVSRAECPHLRNVPLILHWKKLEPRPGEYKFEQYFGESLKAAVADDLHALAMIWVGPACPNWLYEKGVPKVYTDRAVNPLGQKMSKEKNRFPYYQHPEYKTRFFKLFEAFGAYVRDLPPELRQRFCSFKVARARPATGNRTRARRSRRNT